MGTLRWIAQVDIKKLTLLFESCYIWFRKIYRICLTLEKGELDEKIIPPVSHPPQLSR